MLLSAVLYTLIPAAATVPGAAGAAARPPGLRLTAAVQHFAAGIVLAAVALELLPAVRERGAAVAIIGFSAGIVAMYGLRRVTDSLEQPQDAGASDRSSQSVSRSRGGSVPAGLLAAIGVDVFIDGLVLGAGFAAAAQTGLLLTVALTLELLFLACRPLGR